MYRMVSFTCEDSFISHVMSRDDRNTFVGLFYKEVIQTSGEWIISIHKNENGGYDRFEYNMKTNELKESEGDGFVSSDLKSECVIDVSDYGMRFEGSCLYHSPLGYGSLYNTSNELMYRGVMIDDKKECFGIEFYADLGQIEYIGCYCNNQRHGFGMLYDRKGELIYEGDWLCGSNDYEKNMILKDVGNDRIVHSLIHELVIDEGCGNDYKDDLLLCGFDNLERLVVKKNSFQNVNCFKVSANCVLNSIEIEDGEWKDGAFANAGNAIISSMIIDN